MSHTPKFTTLASAALFSVLATAATADEHPPLQNGITVHQAFNALFLKGAEEADAPTTSDPLKLNSEYRKPEQSETVKPKTIEEAREAINLASENYITAEYNIGLCNRNKDAALETISKGTLSQKEQSKLATHTITFCTSAKKALTDARNQVDVATTNAMELSLKLIFDSLPERQGQNPFIEEPQKDWDNWNQAPQPKSF